MRSRIQAIVAPADAAAEFADEITQLFLELNRPGGLGLTGELAPPLDVFETDETVEVVVDLPGVAAASIRILAKGQAILIAGEKAPRRSDDKSTFHLVERGYGRFARAVRLNPACDTARARTRLADGVLTISLPKVAERRNRAIAIPIASGTGA